MYRRCTLRNKFRRLSISYLGNIMFYALLEKIGYYRIKKRWRDYTLRKRLIYEDTKQRESTLCAIESINGLILQKKNDTSDIIVSLTSYGVRVTETLPYSLFSLLKQTIKPNRIIVWLDEKNWNESNLPTPLNKLHEAGVEFMFYEDIRSYKKLIPTLRLYPNNLIITVDDDLYYNQHLIEWLLDAYMKSDKRTVIGTNATGVGVKDGKYLPYSQWLPNDISAAELCLIGCGGILYPPSVFDNEILKHDLFMRLAPTADDLWFWVMEKRVGLRTTVASHYGAHIHTAVNRLNVYFPEENPDTLYYLNELIGNKNDEQLNNLINYYQLSPSV